MTSPRWGAVRDAWEFDGALRDIYVHSTTVLDWQRVVDLVRARGWDASYCEDGDPLPMPTEVGPIFRRSAEVVILWQITPSAGVRVNCHFFDVAEIEFDVDPREIVGQVELDVVCDFVRSVGRVVRKPVLITEENCPDSVILSYDPATDSFGETTPQA